MYKKNIVMSITLSLVLVGCGTSSSKVDDFEISQDLDNGAYEKVISTLGDCSQKAASEQNECYINRGAAYFGLAKFDIISLAQEFTNVESEVKKDPNYSSFTDDQIKEAEDEEFNEIIFSKLFDENLKKGLDDYTQILDSTKGDSVCNETDYDTLSKDEKNACLSISPILLKDSLEDDEDNSTDKSETSTTLNDILDFKDLLKDAAPEINNSDLVTIINDDELDSSNDINDNDDIDIVEATECAINAYDNTTDSFDNTVCSSDNVTINRLSTNIFVSSSDTQYHDIHSLKVTISNGIDSKDFYRQIKKIDNMYTSVSVDLETLVDKDLNNTTGVIDGLTVLAKPLTNDSGSLNSLNDSISEVLNDEDKFKKIALVTAAEDDDKTEEQKVIDLQEEICDSSDINTNNGKCTKDTNGNLIITQEAIFAYMNKKEEA